MHDIKRIADVKPFQKPQDSIFSYYITRKISQVITYLFVRFWPAVTPNMVSVISFFLAVVACILLIFPGYWWRFAGAVLLQLSFAFDCSDGEVARITNLSSKFGAWLDSVLDRFKEIMMFGAMTAYWYTYQQTSVWVIVVGAGAIIGLLLVSYLREAKKSSWPTTRTSEIFISKNVYIGTVDVTIYLVSLAVVVNLEYVALWIFLLVSIPLVLKQLSSAYRLSQRG